MGRTRRWLKGLFGMNKKDASKSSFPDRGNKKSSSFCHSLRRVNSTGLINSTPTTQPNISPTEAAWLRMMSPRPLYGDDKEHNKQAIAVAAVSATVAKASVEVADAAVELVRLTSLSRGPMLNYTREVLAAITIQTIFRGFLARKALRALKALVKVQALVRGFLIRKQTYETLHCMEALIRAQQIVRVLKDRSVILKNHHGNCPTQFQPRKYPEKFDNSRKIIKVASGNKRIYSPFESNVTDIDQCIKGRPRRIKKFMNDFNEDESYFHANAPIDQAKSECGDVYFRNENTNYPNYMINTQSFNSKVRSQSVPKQRGDEFSWSKRRLTLNELIMIESKTCQNGAKMKTSCSQAQGNINFKNNVMAKIGSN
ncbi:hypothetical protein LIER_10765 [Lithospermum erythrorhizon]|uniref:DUF4005 domain-containing protein n=1 Tax=Lithospermum erythrorhizon TaxID=34254 RepID=A0AAV3PM10_LITER